MSLHEPFDQHDPERKYPYVVYFSYGDGLRGSALMDFRGGMTTWAFLDAHESITKSYGACVITGFQPLVMTHKGGAQ